MAALPSVGLAQAVLAPKARTGEHLREREQLPWASGPGPVLWVAPWVTGARLAGAAPNGLSWRRPRLREGLARQLHPRPR